MRVFSYIAFVFFGVVVGGALGGAGGSLVGGVVGFLIFRRIEQSGFSLSAATRSDAGHTAVLDDLWHEVRQLREEVVELTRRIDALSGNTGDFYPVSSPSHAVEPSDSPVAEPEPAVPPSPVDARVLPTPALPERVSVESASAHLEPESATRVSDTYDPFDDTAPGFRAFQAIKGWLLGGNTLVRVGVVVLFFGLAFLVKFAAEHAVLPVEARYIGISIGALVSLVFGWRLRSSRPEYAMALQGLGVASLYLVTFAAFRIHSLLPGSLTMAILVATCVLSAALAVLQNARSLAVIGICGGFLAPVLASTGGGNHVALFSYYALLNAGIVGIAWFKAWRPLNVLGFFLTFGIGSLWASRNYHDELFVSTEPFLLIFFGLYLIVALLYATRRKTELSQYAVEVSGERIDYVDGTLVFGNPLAAFGLQYLMVKDMQYGSAFSALGLGMIYLPLATALYRRGRDEFRLLVESFLALGVIFASLAIPLGLDANWTSAAWAAEGAGIFWVGLRQQRRAARAFALILQLGSAVSLLISLKQPGSENVLGLVPVFDGSFLGPVFVGLAAVGTAGLIRRSREMVSQSEGMLEPIIMVAGLGFLNLAFPMFLDQSWSGLAFALSGAAIVWRASRMGHVAAMGFGLVLQLLGGVAFGSATSSNTTMPLLNRFWTGSLLISGSGLVSGWSLQKSSGALGQISVLGLVWGLIWWSGSGLQEISNHSASEFVLSGYVAFATLTALLFSVAGRRVNLRDAEAASMLLLPALLIFAIYAFDQKTHAAADGGWLVWPIAIVTMLFVLRRQENGSLARLLNGSHAFALLFVTSLATWECWWWFHELGDSGSAWPIFGWTLSPLAATGLLTRETVRSRWPVAAFPRAYGFAAIPIVAGLWLWIIFANTLSDGSASPLPYLPVANPIDLATAAALFAILTWTRCWQGTSDNTHLIRTFLAATSFFWLNGVLLRTLHHWADVPFNFDVMMHSTLVQSSLSLFWATIALALMLFATRQHLRTIWLVGGGLLVGVVGKLFLVDLSRVGTIERIVSFIGVGILLLVVGYFSPVPPRRADQT